MHCGDQKQRHIVLHKPESSAPFTTPLVFASFDKHLTQMSICRETLNSSSTVTCGNLLYTAHILVLLQDLLA